LFYKESNIDFVVGDANTNEFFEKIPENSKFDIIIDDGSHTSSDIIKTFYLNFNELNDGGLFYPLSSINFFKRLVDILNFEHRGIEKNRDWLLRLFMLNYNLDVNILALEHIHSIEFVNSMCFIRKKSRI